jgi:uncharacterized protein YecE (DUF72 family)
MRRLKGAEDETNYLIDVVSSLEKKLGVVFFQLPPNFKKDMERLGAFLDILPENIPIAFEFRHATWFDDEVFGLLRAHNIALCLADADDELEVPLVSTADWGYLRLRRPEYPPAEMKKWRAWVESQEWDEAFVFFKHEDAGAGPKMAAEFLALAK